MEPIQLTPPPDHYAGLGIHAPAVGMDQHEYIEIIADPDDEQLQVCTDIVYLCANGWPLHGTKCYCSNTVKGTDFIFDKHVPTDSPDMIPLIFFEKGRELGYVTPKFLGGKC